MKKVFLCSIVLLLCIDAGMGISCWIGTSSGKTVSLDDAGDNIPFKSCIQFAYSEEEFAYSAASVEMIPGVYPLGDGESITVCNSNKCNCAGDCAKSGDDSDGSGIKCWVGDNDNHVEIDNLGGVGFKSCMNATFMVDVVQIVVFSGAPNDMVNGNYTVSDASISLCKTNACNCDSEVCKSDDDTTTTSTPNTATNATTSTPNTATDATTSTPNTATDATASTSNTATTSTFYLLQILIFPTLIARLA